MGAAEIVARYLEKEGRFFVLGVVSSLVPCPPLVAIFLLAANKGTLLGGISYGLFYGLGLMVSPMLIIGGGLAMISESIKKKASFFHPYIKGLTMFIMVSMAANMIMTG